MDLINYLATFVFGVIVTLFYKSYFPSYLSEKGKNLATKEDIEQITKIVEQIKLEFSKDLEFLKWQLTKKANIHRLIAEREVTAIAEIGSSLFDLRIATEYLRPALDHLPNDNDKKRELFERRFETWAEKHDLFLTCVEKHRLFLPSSLYKEFLNIKSLAVSEGVSFETEFKYMSLDFTLEQYQCSLDKKAKLVAAIDDVASCINQRYEIEGLTSITLNSHLD